MQGRSSAREFKSAAYEAISRVGKALASPKRLELLDLLSQRPWTVEVLARESGQTIGNASQHLRVLRAARLVESEKQGLYVTYRIAGESVEALVARLRLLAGERLAEIERTTREFLENRGQFEAVDRETLVQRVQRREVVVLDVRSDEEYQAGHLPGALSIPLDQLEARLGELPADQEIVAYCRGPYCVMSIDAVELLRARGFRALRLEEGPADWRARGFEVEIGEATA